MRDEARPAVRARPACSALHELPRVHRRRADVAGLARLHDVVQRLQRLLDRRVGSPSGGSGRGRRSRCRAAAGWRRSRVMIALRDRPAPFGPGPHRARGPWSRSPPRRAGRSPQRPADDLLAGAVGIDVGGVEEVDAELERPLDERPALLLVERPGVVAPVRARRSSCSRGRGATPSTGPAELHILHRRSFQRLSDHPTANRQMHAGLWYNALAATSGTEIYQHGSASTRQWTYQCRHHGRWSRTMLPARLGRG